VNLFVGERRLNASKEKKKKKGGSSQAHGRPKYLGEEPIVAFGREGKKKGRAAHSLIEEKKRGSGGSHVCIAQLGRPHT